MIKGVLVTIVMLEVPQHAGRRVLPALQERYVHEQLLLLACRFARGQLIEVNAHSLFSKWFSESGKLVSRLFAKITELVSAVLPQK